jgi:hypothetical protein
MRAPRLAIIASELSACLLAVAVIVGWTIHGAHRSAGAQRVLPPAEIVGVYYYRGRGEPIVEIRADGSGLFQPHGMPPVPFTVIDVDGTHRAGMADRSHRCYTLLVRYGEGGGGTYRAGSFDLLEVAIRRDEGIALVQGERIRRL